MENLNIVRGYVGLFKIVVKFKLVTDLNRRVQCVSELRNCEGHVRFQVYLIL